MKPAMKLSFEPIRRTDQVERMILDRILMGSPGDALPSERELALDLQVNRQPIREALQRLSRDGWIRIQHGKPTTIRDYETEGGLPILDGLARQKHVDPNWIVSLLEVRLALAPAYGMAAVRCNPAKIEAYLSTAPGVDDTADVFTVFDWELHRLLCIESGNPVYTMLLNSFAGIYMQSGFVYFGLSTARDSSVRFYRQLKASLPDDRSTGAVIESMMKRSIEIWQAAWKKKAPRKTRIH